MVAGDSVRSERRSQPGQFGKNFAGASRVSKDVAGKEDQVWLERNRPGYRLPEADQVEREFACVNVGEVEHLNARPPVG